MNYFASALPFLSAAQQGLMGAELQVGHVKDAAEESLLLLFILLLMMITGPDEDAPR